MPGSDIDLLIDAADAAGKIALRVPGPRAKSWEKADGTGLVTESDLAVNERLAEILRPARPGYGWLSEESDDDADRLSRGKVFIVDPIDGTRSFAEGSSTWAHALAVAEDGIVTSAVIYLPKLGKLYSAVAGKGAFLNGEPIAPSTRPGLENADILAARPALDAHHWRDGAAPKFHRVYRPSLAYRMAMVAQGRFDGMITLRPSWEWDVAAGDLILREAGARVTDRAGLTLKFNNAHPMVNGILAGGAAVHGQLAAAVSIPS
ncbi:inositol monophosphatase family protein [Chachezhania antarctica]|uniref:inositol monophosphatase family protein n=1 Tax=Chachezhania antarctica TaxID=2340860 RepID=UPI000EAED46B|nr:3'(2'),5'-bisphosphate nucleotidase CysQ [Chachezhania antarctica]